MTRGDDQSRRQTTPSTMMRNRLALLLTSIALGCSAPNEDTPRATPTDTPAPPIAAGSATDSATCLSRTLVGTGLGVIRVGLPVDSVARPCDVVRDTTVLADEGEMARKLTVADGADTVVAEIFNARIRRLEVTDADIRTSDSIGVGTTLASLLRLPDARRIAGEGRVFVVSPGHCGLSFQLDLSGPATAVNDLRRLPAETKVSRVLVVGCETR